MWSCDKDLVVLHGTSGKYPSMKGQCSSSLFTGRLRTRWLEFEQPPLSKSKKWITEQQDRRNQNLLWPWSLLVFYRLLLYERKRNCLFKATFSRKKVKSLSRVRLFATPWSIAHQAPLPMGFSRQEYWSGLPFPSARGSSQLRDWTQLSCIAGRCFNLWATREVDKKSTVRGEAKLQRAENNFSLNFFPCHKYITFIFTVDYVAKGN